MNLHEYQAGTCLLIWLALYFNVFPVLLLMRLLLPLKKLGGGRWVVTCQVHAGGCGKAVA